jgi:hypothetical protein
MSLFRIECICDDKNLAKVLRALASVGAKNVMPIPLVNGSSNSGLPPKVAAIWEKIKAAQVKAITSAEMKSLLQEIGLQKSSFSYALTTLTKAKLLRANANTRGKYEVVA